MIILSLHYVFNTKSMTWWNIIDDDLSSSTGYHNALPLEVHGAGYNQMAMVSNSKALRLVNLLFMINLTTK